MIAHTAGEVIIERQGVCYMIDTKTYTIMHAIFINNNYATQTCTQ